MSPRFKLVPNAPPDLEGLVSAQLAIPLVPGNEGDCCGRLMRRLDLPTRDVARTWLTFLRALGLVSVGPAGFSRTSQPIDRDVLAGKFRRNIFGVEEILAILDEAEGPRTAEEVFGRMRDRVPVWERQKLPHLWEQEWQRRVTSILEWADLFDLIRHTHNGYERR